MNTKPARSAPTAQPWVEIGGPAGGMVTSLAVSPGGTVFAGTRVGVFRSSAAAHRAGGWERLPNAPAGILSLALSPLYEQDQALFVGTQDGIWTSNDAGEHWQAAQTPLARSAVLTIVPSPVYAQDSQLIAGTAEDGVLFSDSRGERWHTRNFGLLDGTIFALAFSPAYERDGILFAGAGTTVYYSYNGGRAWKQLPFPDDAAPVLCLAVSPGFEADGVLFAGTETQGLFRSNNRGASWQPVDLPAASINALCSLPEGGMLAATGDGLFFLPDGGEPSGPLLDVEDPICLAAGAGRCLAGTTSQGVFEMAPAVRSAAGWQPLGRLAARAMLGLVLSPDFERSGLGWMVGFQDGIWKTEDGGATWRDLSDALPVLEIYDLALRPGDSPSTCLAAATSGGVLLSMDGGEGWEPALAGEGQAERVTFSPDGRTLAAYLEGTGLIVSGNLGATWQTPGQPWEVGDRLLALAAGDQGWLFAATLDGPGQTIRLWQARAGQWQMVHAQPAGANPVVSLWIPPNSAAGPWFAALGSNVLKFDAQAGSEAVRSSVLEAGEMGETILSLAGAGCDGQITLLASAGRRLYGSQDGEAWRMIHDFGSDRALQVALAGAGAQQKTAYALLLGGMVWQGGWSAGQ